MGILINYLTAQILSEVIQCATIIKLTFPAISFHVTFFADTWKWKHFDKDM